MRENLVVAAVLLGAALPVQAAPVDLSSWTVNSVGSASWVLEPGNNAVNQGTNGSPTAFFNGENSQGKALKGTIEVRTQSDDDFIGFVLGYNAGDFSNPAADYLLVDWKKASQGGFFGGTALVGLAISRVTGVLGDDAGSWLHNPAFNVTEIARATTLGSTGWQSFVEYTFDLVFTETLVEISVNGVKELSIAGSFSDGSFGFYNYSQADVRYAGIQQTVLPPIDPPVPPVPLPAAGWMMIAGLGALATLRRRRKA